MKKTIFAGLFYVFFTYTFAQQLPPAAFEEKYCSGCHAIDKKMVGPAISEIANKYKNQNDAQAYLSQKIRKGGVGVWGKVAMPGAEVSDEELAQLVNWILAVNK